VKEKGIGVGRSRVKGSLKREVFAHPGEILTDLGEMRARRGSWAKSLDGQAPLHLELGMGRGRFLADLAARENRVNYVGVELKPDRCVTAREKIRRKARRPFVVLNLAGEVLLSVFAPGEVQRIYLNFPDPWPSHMYRARRMFGESFLRIHQELLAPGGELLFRSDQPDCYEELLSSLPRHLKLAEHGRDLHGVHEAMAGGLRDFKTEYERRYLAAGASIHYARLIKEVSGIVEIRAGC
jgi:tRNA (guanine-N7-)-methyltransferase